MQGTNKKLCYLLSDKMRKKGHPKPLQLGRQTRPFKLSYLFGWYIVTYLQIHILTI